MPGIQSFANRLCLLCLCALVLLPGAAAAETQLEQYVQAPDSAFEFKLVDTAYTYLYTTYIFEVTSQRWHEGDVYWHADTVETNGKWKHWLRIIEPRLFGQYTGSIPFFSLVRSDTALLYLLRGDARHKQQPSGATLEEALPALATRSIIAEIDGIPIGPMAFLDEQPDGYDPDDDSYFCKLLNDDDECENLRSEDSLQARSFDLALSTGDFSWALMAPMTKAAVRAMDVVQQFLRERNFGREVVKKFVLTGHSKRGHIVWLTAALDSRVVAVAPVSYDLLNLAEQIALQDASWPARSPEQDANAEFDLYTRYKTDIGIQLIADLDPYAYRDRLDIPALILVSTGDPYSCSDAAGLYIGDLPQANIQYVPNTGHDIREAAQVVSQTASFYRHIASGRQLPDFTWTGLEQGMFTVMPAGQKPLEAKLWTATNPASRDFRWQADNQTAVQWTAAALEAGADGAFSGAVPLPAAGFTAYYIELVYRGANRKSTLSLATPIQILGQ